MSETEKYVYALLFLLFSLAVVGLAIYIGKKVFGPSITAEIEERKERRMKAELHQAVRQFTASDLICPITNEPAKQTAIKVANMTSSDINNCTTIPSCGHKHELVSPRGYPYWVVDGIATTSRFLGEV